MAKAAPKKAPKKAPTKAATKKAPKASHRSLSRIPKQIPKGLTLCHNHIRHEATTKPNTNGFRVWMTNEPPANFVSCSCGWSGLPHLALKGLGKGTTR
jgi:hypothetical protein